MRSSSIAAILVVGILVVAGAAAAIMLTDNNRKEIKETEDVAGYEIVPVEDDFENGIVAIGQDTFRWVTYFGLADKCVMVDLNDKTNYMGKTFMYVGKGQALSANSDLKFGTSNCSIGPDDVKTILDLQPSIVVVPASWESEHANEMKALRNAELNIVHIDYIYTFLEKDTFEITPELNKQVDVLSRAFNMSERGQEIIELIDDTVKDIRSIASKISDEEKKSGYIGSLAYNGPHAVDSSMTYFMPFALANIDNIMSSAKQYDSESGVYTYSADDIHANINDNTVLFLDATGIATCIKEKDNASKILKLFIDHEAYVSYPYIWTGINYENVLICAYQMLHDVYGLLTDDELNEKVDTIYEKMLGSSDSLRNEKASNVDVPAEGTSIYDDQCALFEEKWGTPTHGEINIDSDGNIKYV